MASPRAKGIFPEDHPLYLGVTGLGGHDVAARLEEYRPEHVLVLGTRLGEMTSFWDARLIPPGGLVHVDVDPDAFGRAYPDAPTLAITADAARFAQSLAARLPPNDVPLLHGMPPLRSPEPRAQGPVRPSALMAAIQRVVVERSRAIVLTEAGNAFAWTTHALRFREAGRYRVSTGFGSMGMATAGVVGVAAATRTKAVAVVGDGAMLMHQEVSTAVQERLPAVWIVLNDACYGMIEQGMRALGWSPFAVDIPRVDFVALARAVGADGVRVEREHDLDAALETALQADQPFVVDVITDPAETAPTGARNQSLSRGFGGR
jgi:acetolactate synthase-1/2/3 large subunit